MIALFIAILLSVPFAIFVVKYKKVSEITLQVAGILQTIPSLALLGLFIPLLGIGKVPPWVAARYLRFVPDFAEHDYRFAEYRSAPSGSGRCVRHESLGKAQKV